MDNFLKILSGVAIIICVYFYWDLFTINRTMFMAAITCLVVIVSSIIYLTKSGTTSSFISSVDRIELLAIIMVTTLALTLISASSVIKI